MEELPVKEGWTSPALREEFPGLGFRYLTLEARQGRSTRGAKEQLRYLSDRLHGRRALQLRREPIVSAYRVFFRQIGLDPDESRTPIEAAVLERLRAGGFASRGLVDDALTIATVETGVPVRALDGDRLNGRLGLRLAESDERLGGEPSGLKLPPGALVMADEQVAVGLIFGETAPGREVDKNTRRVTICAVQVQGVPDISIEEAIWSCAGTLRESEQNV